MSDEKLPFSEPEDGETAPTVANEAAVASDEPVVAEEGEGAEKDISVGAAECQASRADGQSGSRD